jgi:glycosyltransferase involved in cell wall biosynthesis
MRLGLVVYEGLDATSGGFRYDRRLVAGLRDRGHEVTVVALSRDGYGRNLLDNVDRGIRARLGDLDVDVLLQDELCHPSLAWHNRRLSGTPVVSIVHHLRSSEPRPIPERAVYRAVERRYLRTVDAFVYNTDVTRTTVERLVGPTEGVVAPPAGDHFDPDLSRERIDERAHQPGPLRVAFVGSIVPRKGLHTLVRGLADHAEAGWTLTVVGDPTVDERYARRVRALVAALEVGDAVEFAGRVPDGELAGRLRRSHVLAVPSTYEGFGMVYLEGMGFGLPAIATAAGGASEVVTDGTTGFLVPPEEPGAVGEAVDALATDRDLLATVGVAARDRFEAHPSWTEVVDQVEQFLEATADR